MTRLQRWLIDTIGYELDHGDMTQGQLARRAGYTEKYVSEMMNGHKGSVRSYGRLFDALEIPLPGAFKEDQP